MAQDAAFKNRIQRIGELVERLETTTDLEVRAAAKELLESLMALHGAALERILELSAEAGPPGQTVIQKCGHDDLVGSVLLLYGLHPEDLSSRVNRALDKLHHYLQTHSAKAELLSICDDGRVSVRLHVQSGGCGSTATAVKSTLEAALADAAPDASSILVEETGAALTPAGFVSLAQLLGSPAIAPAALEQARRSGD